MVARRNPLGFRPRAARYAVVEAANISALLYMPILAGYWKQKELKDGTYNYIDLLDIVEAMQVQSENQWRDFESGRKE